MSYIYQAVNANVFIKEIKLEEKIGVMLTPDTFDSDYVFGEVITCAEGYFDRGRFVPALVAPGDIVGVARQSTVKVNLNNMQLLRVYMNDIVVKRVEGEILDEPVPQTAQK